MKDSHILILLGCLGLGGLAGLVHMQGESVWRGRIDFMPFYVGPYLLETGDLYCYPCLMEAEKNMLGSFGEEHGYIRPPFHAALLWPLSRLPYLTAYWIWQIASLLAIAAFVWLWRPPEFSQRFFWAGVSVPLAHTFINGQDVGFLLLLVAVSYRLRESGMPFRAGAVFSLCAAKFHLFLLLPVLIVARREWKFGQGLLAGGAVLTALSFGVAGWDWPAEMIQSALTPKFSPHTDNMPNLHGAAMALPASAVWEIALSAVAVAAAWVAARRAPYPVALGACLVGSLLLSRHSYLLDTALALPAGLAVTALAESKLLKAGAAFLLSPVAALSIGWGAPLSSAVVGVMLIWLVGMAWEANRGAMKTRVAV